LQTIDPRAVESQLNRLTDLKASRDTGAVELRLNNLSQAARDESQNLLPFIIQAVKQYATLGEITETLKKVFGEYTG